MTRAEREKKAYRAANGVPFIVRQITEDGQSIVEFYDARFDFTEFGQFVSRYYLETFCNHPSDCGLNLDGGVEAWTIDADTFRDILHDLRLFA